MESDKAQKSCSDSSFQDNCARRFADVVWRKVHFSEQKTHRAPPSNNLFTSLLFSSLPIPAFQALSSLHTLSRLTQTHLQESMHKMSEEAFPIFLPAKIYWLQPAAPNKNSGTPLRDAIVFTWLNTSSALCTGTLVTVNCRFTLIVFHKITHEVSATVFSPDCRLAQPHLLILLNRFTTRLPNKISGVSLRFSQQLEEKGLEVLRLTARSITYYPESERWNTSHSLRVSCCTVEVTSLKIQFEPQDHPQPDFTGSSSEFTLAVHFDWSIYEQVTTTHWPFHILFDGWSHQKQPPPPPSSPPHDTNPAIPPLRLCPKTSHRMESTGPDRLPWQWQGGRETEKNSRSGANSGQASRTTKHPAASDVRCLQGRLNLSWM